MANLIKMNFTRLFKSLLFKICLLFSAGFAVFAVVIRSIDINSNAEAYTGLLEYSTADVFMFGGANFLIFAAAAFVGIFIGTEYSDGTIRNKLSVGHIRFKVYLANFIVSAFANIMILLVYLLLSLGMGLIFLDAPTLDFNQIAIFSLSQMLAMTSFTAIIVLCAMLISNRAIGVVTALVIWLVMVSSAMSISARLMEREYIFAPTFSEETGEIEVEATSEKNPHYLTGTKRKVFEFLNNALPANQFNQVSDHKSDNLGIMAVYSAVTIVLANGIGIVVFRKKDLK